VGLEARILDSISRICNYKLLGYVEYTVLADTFKICALPQLDWSELPMHPNASDVI
jgi:hypothetical protein